MTGRDGWRQAGSGVGATPSSPNPSQAVGDGCVAITRTGSSALFVNKSSYIDTGYSRRLSYRVCVRIRWCGPVRPTL